MTTPKSPEDIAKKMVHKWYTSWFIKEGNENDILTDDLLLLEKQIATAIREARTVKIPENRINMNQMDLKHQAYIDGYNAAIDEIKRMNGIETVADLNAKHMKKVHVQEP